VSDRPGQSARSGRTEQPVGPPVDGRPVHGRSVHGRPVHFGGHVILSKAETFEACQALADAGRVLVRTGGFEEADTLGSLFELLEERLVTG